MPPKPEAWKDIPSLMEHLLPVQKLSAESYKEQMAGNGKTLTALGGYWKGRKPLILARACILGALLPATENPLKDLEIFELLMGMAPESMGLRLEAKLPASKKERVQELLQGPYAEQVRQAKRPEEMGEDFLNAIWERVNAHLGTDARSLPELVEQMGVARFGHPPRMGDVFCGSGQIPFEAARLGCRVYASDLNPVACMLTWGAFSMVGGSAKEREIQQEAQKKLVARVQREMDALGVESSGDGWKAKDFLYCLEVRCPESGWRVPLLPSRVISTDYKVIAVLRPLPEEKRYAIDICYVDSPQEVEAAKRGTLEGGYMVHSPGEAREYRISIGDLRGDYTQEGERKNRLRLWEKWDIVPREEDIFQERLYCVQWMKREGGREEYAFRSVTPEDRAREEKVTAHVQAHLEEWQERGWVPDMVIEAGDKTDEPIRTRGWTHWHHLFNPRQLLLGALCRKEMGASEAVQFGKLLDYNAKLCLWDPNPGPGRVGKTYHVFYNQALNTLYSYACRASAWSVEFFEMEKFKSFPCPCPATVKNHPAEDLDRENDIYITDPPYGDAVKYEEITEYFIAWLRKNPPEEFRNWVWDSRRALAIKGEDEHFRSGMIRAYRKMAEKMPPSGIQVLMFTHQSGTIWGDMAHIVWASGLQVTAAWYVVTETDSALRRGANVKGTVLLVLRKRRESRATFRDDLAWEIQEVVQEQVQSLMGLDQSVRRERSEGLYTDADLHMAGYAAALKVLTSYAVIDGKDMVTEASIPRRKGVKTLVEELIDFAVQRAVQFLVPLGFTREEWQKMQPPERFYLKMAELEHQGEKTLDNYQNFAKAFKVRDFSALLSDASRANATRLKLSGEFKGSMMSGSSEMASTPLRALLYALYEIRRGDDLQDVLLHLMDNCPDYLARKPLLTRMAEYLGEKREGLKPTRSFAPQEEARAARILAEALRTQRL